MAVGAGVIAGIAAGCAVAVGIVVSIILVRHWQRQAKAVSQDIEKGKAISKAIQVKKAAAQCKALENPGMR